MDLALRPRGRIADIAERQSGGGIGENGRNAEEEEDYILSNIIDFFRNKIGVSPTFMNSVHEQRSQYP
jgi:hypothetical protein